MKWKGPFVSVLVAMFVFVPALVGVIQPAAAAATGNEPVPGWVLEKPAGGPAGAKNCEKFDTGFYVCDDFLRYFHSVGLDLGDQRISERENIALWGYPITQPFNYDGMWVQVMERAVFELHPEFAGTPYYVEYRRLGAELLDAGAFPKQFVAASAVTCDQSFPQTGKCLSGDFLRFWKDNGGLSVFGYPMTNATDLNGIWSQVTERWVFELHPENKGTAYYVEGRRLGADWLAARMPGSVSAQNCTATKLGPYNPGATFSLNASNGAIVMNVWGNTNPNYPEHKVFLAEGQVWNFTAHAGGAAWQYPKGCQAAAQKDFAANSNPEAKWDDLHSAGIVQ